MDVIEKGVYACSIIISLGSDKYSISEKTERWKLWTDFKNKCIVDDDKKDVLIKDVLKTTYPLDYYSLTSVHSAWGCIDDIDLYNGDVRLLNLKGIYSPIQIYFEAYGNPPFRWCEYMKTKGFVCSLYFMNINNKKVNENTFSGYKSYGESINTSQFYKLPILNEEELKNIYNDPSIISDRKYSMGSHCEMVFSKSHIPLQLSELMDMYGVGPKEVGIKTYYKFECFKKLDELEEKLENKQINEGEYLKKVNKIKKTYDVVNHDVFSLTS